TGPTGFFARRNACYDERAFTRAENPAGPDGSEVLWWHPCGGRLLSFDRGSVYYGLDRSERGWKVDALQPHRRPLPPRWRRDLVEQQPDRRATALRDRPSRPHEDVANPARAPQHDGPGEPDARSEEQSGRAFVEHLGSPEGRPARGTGEAEPRRGSLAYTATPGEC